MAQGRAIGTFSAGTDLQQGDFILRSVQAVSANVGATQATGTQINAEVATVASGGANYSVVLPQALPGMTCTVLLTTSSNTSKVFPALGDAINALGANSSITMAALTRATFYCVVAGQWWTNPLLPS